MRWRGTESTASGPLFRSLPLPRIVAPLLRLRNGHRASRPGGASGEAILRKADTSIDSSFQALMQVQTSAQTYRARAVLRQEKRFYKLALDMPPQLGDIPRPYLRAEKPPSYQFRTASLRS